MKKENPNKKLPWNATYQTFKNLEEFKEYVKRRKNNLETLKKEIKKEEENES